MEEEEEGLQSGGRLVSVCFPFVRWNLRTSEQSQTWFFGRFVHAIRSLSGVKTVMECANSSLCAHSVIRWGFMDPGGKFSWCTSITKDKQMMWEEQYFDFSRLIIIVPFSSALIGQQPLKFSLVPFATYCTVKEKKQTTEYGKLVRTHLPASVT